MRACYTGETVGDREIGDAASWCGGVVALIGGAERAASEPRSGYFGGVISVTVPGCTGEPGLRPRGPVSSMLCKHTVSVCMWLRSIHLKDRADAPTHHFKYTRTVPQRSPPRPPSDPLHRQAPIAAEFASFAHRMLRPQSPAALGPLPANRRRPAGEPACDVCESAIAITYGAEQDLRFCQLPWDLRLCPTAASAASQIPPHVTI
jgi:hypothetical protein